jgi:hypothetical protein
MIDHTIFEDLQAKIDEEAAVRDVSKISAGLLAKPGPAKRWAKD